MAKLKEVKRCRFFSKKELEERGWVFFSKRGDYEIWRQAREELYYCPSSGLVLGVYQIS